MLKNNNIRRTSITIDPCNPSKSIKIQLYNYIYSIYTSTLQQMLPVFPSPVPRFTTCGRVRRVVCKDFVMDLHYTTRSVPFYTPRRSRSGAIHVGRDSVNPVSPNPRLPQFARTVASFDRLKFHDLNSCGHVWTC